jgi:hypothetical protein
MKSRFAFDLLLSREALKSKTAANACFVTIHSEDFGQKSPARVATFVRTNQELDYYKTEIYLNGELAKTVEFKIE